MSVEILVLVAIIIFMGIWAIIGTLKGGFKNDMIYEEAAIMAQDRAYIETEKICSERSIPLYDEDDERIYSLKASQIFVEVYNEELQKILREYNIDEP